MSNLTIELTLLPEAKTAKTNKIRLSKPEFRWMSGFFMIRQTYMPGLMLAHKHLTNKSL